MHCPCNHTNYSSDSAYNGSSSRTVMNEPGNEDPYQEKYYKTAHHVDPCDNNKNSNHHHHYRYSHNNSYNNCCNIRKRPYKTILCGFGDNSLFQLSLESCIRLPSTAAASAASSSPRQHHHQSQQQYESVPTVYSLQHLLQDSSVQLCDAFCGDCCSFFKTSGHGRVFACGDNGMGGLGVINEAKIDAFGDNYHSDDEDEDDDGGGDDGGGGADHMTIRIMKQNAEIQLPRVVNFMRHKYPETSISKVACGSFYTIFLTDDHQVFVCGDNQSGNLAVGHYDNVTRPVNITPHINEVIGPNAHIVEIACGEYFSLFRASTGHIYACGYDAFGQLGLGTHVRVTNDMKCVNRLVPIYMSHITQRGEAIIRMKCGSSFQILISDKHNAWVCGDNLDGQIGLGVSVEKVKTPTLLTQFEGNIHDVSCGFQHTVILTRDHKLYACGANHYGQLGLGTVDARVSVPTLIPNNEESGFFNDCRIESIVSIGHRSFFISKQLDLWACGYNAEGQLGLGHVQEAVTRPTFVNYREALVKALQYQKMTHSSELVVPSTQVLDMQLVCGLDQNFMLLKVADRTVQSRLIDRLEFKEFCDVDIIAWNPSHSLTKYSFNLAVQRGETTTHMDDDSATDAERTCPPPQKKRKLEGAHSGSTSCTI